MEPGTGKCILFTCVLIQVLKQAAGVVCAHPQTCLPFHLPRTHAHVHTDVAALSHSRFTGSTSHLCTRNAQADISTEGISGADGLVRSPQCSRQSTGSESGVPRTTEDSRIRNLSSSSASCPQHVLGWGLK